jgi:flagellar hook assembly protein FlgD
LDNVTYALVYSNHEAVSLPGAIITDNLPPASQEAYVANSASNGGVYNPSSNTLTWSIGPLAPGAAVTETYTLQVEVQTRSDGVYNLVNNACVSFSGWETCAFVTVTVGGPYTINVSVYNQAGELVKNLSNFQFGSPITNWTLANGVIQTDSQEALVLDNGVTLGTWDATNSNGQKVTNGTYFIKTMSVDPFGVVTTVTKTITVNLEESNLRIAVYNEAGERVKNWSESDILSLLGSGAALQAADFNVETIRLSSYNFSTSPAGGNNAAMTITLGSGQSITWNGTADNGGFLRSGNYFMEFQSSQPNKSSQQVVVQVHILDKGGNMLSGTVFAPNPINLNLTTKGRFLVNAYPGQITSVRIKLYTLTGECFQTLSSEPGNPAMVTWDLSNKMIASGAYIAVVESYSVDGLIGRNVLKMLVIH